MRCGVALPNFRPLGTRDALVEIARQAGARGYDSIWSTDIVVQTPGPADKRFAHSVEAVTVTPCLAALTTRRQPGISVLVLPPRGPLLAAKEAPSRLRYAPSFTGAGNRPSA